MKALATYISIFIILLISTPIIAQNYSFSADVTTTRTNSEYKILEKKFTDFKIFDFSNVALSNIIQKKPDFFGLSLSLGENHLWDLRLENSHLLANNYITNTDQGRPLDRPKIFTSKGYLSNEATNSLAALTFTNQTIYGFIQTTSETYYIEPLSYLINGGSKNLHIVYSAKDVIVAHPMTCAVDDHSSKKNSPYDPVSSEKMMNCLVVELAIASDLTMLSKYGSVAEVENHNIGVMNNVNTDYDDSFQDEIRFEIVEQFVVTSNDPWSDSNSIDVILDEFTAWAPTGFTNTHDLGQHWSSRDYNGSTIGLAWVGVVCGNFRYHVLEDFSSNANFLRVLTSHEIGHNFNLDHDGTGTATIMAPSVNNTTTWSAGSVTGLNDFVSGLNCLSSCPPDQPPSSSFDSNFSVICPGGNVQFTDQSTNDPNAWSWSFPGGNPANSIEQNPIVSYQNVGTYAVSLTSTNNSGSDTETIAGFITVNNTGIDLFHFESFEQNVGSYTIENPDGFITWEHVELAGSPSGTGAMFINNFNYNQSGQTDALISPILDFSGRSNTTLVIEYAYTNFNQQFNDSLKILISNNDGITYQTIFAEGETGDGTLATRPTLGSAFTPQDATDWCHAGTWGASCINLDLSNFSSPTTKVKIENKTGFGNNMFITSVALSSSCQETVLAPMAGFTTEVTEGCAPFTVQYFDTSSNNPSSWNWSFPGGNPSSSNVPNPIVTYFNSGSYDAFLNVSNAGGSDSHNSINNIYVFNIPTSNFSFSSNQTTVNFLDNSSGDNITNYFWDFGDDNTSIVPNPNHFYDAPGEYLVNFTITNLCGSHTSTQIIEVNEVPQADFEASQESNCTDQQILFTNTSTGLHNTYLWTFDGGTPSTSTEINPNVTYSTPGLYSVTLVATNPEGTSSETKEEFITIIEAPSAQIDYSINGLEVTFSSTMENSETWSWNFGDGEESSEINPVHIYEESGTYTVSLTVSNLCDAITVTTDVAIVLIMPSAAFNFEQTSICAPATVQFFNLSSNAEQLIWQFEGGNPSSSQLENPIITFDNAGNYNATLIASNPNGNDQQSSSVIVNIMAEPTADIQSSTNGLSVDFSANDQNTDQYSWNFGDDNTSNLPNPSHSYQQEGTYNVSLIVSNVCYEIEFNTQITVQDNSVMPSAAFNFEQTSICAPATVQFFNLSSNAEQLIWQFEGGNPSSSQLENPIITFDNAGNYNATLIASNPNGNDQQSSSVIVNIMAEPTADIQSSTNGLSVDFSANDQNTDQYSWNFGDDNTSNLPNPSHSYQQEGTYNVSLIVSNVCYEIEFNTQIIVQDNSVMPSAAFNFEQTSICAPATVQFFNLSSNAEQLIWQFEGGNPSSSQLENPIITFDNAGNYNATLIASNPNGNDQQSSSVIVNIMAEPTADIQSSTNGLSVDFSANDQNTDQYSWNFGDDNTSNLPNPSHSYQQEGTYNVSLIVSNVCYEIEFNTQIIVQDNSVMPSAAFNFEQTSICAPATVQFFNLSSNTEQLIWQFEGGNPSSSQLENPIITFDNAGNYNATLIASNPNGNDQQSSSVIVNIMAEPTADIQSSTNGLSVDFSANDQNTDQYSWNFGDDNTSNLPNPSHSYQQEGTYNVSLIVSNVCYEIEFNTQIIVQDNSVMPSAAFNFEQTSICAPATVQFFNLSSNTEQLIWQFEGGNPSSSQLENPIITFDNAGNYNATLIASNPNGNDQQSSSIIVNIMAEPTADIQSSTNGLSVDFSANDQNTDQYSWNFGDDNTSNLPNPSHSYQQEGTYNVSLIVSNVCYEIEFNTQVQVNENTQLPVPSFIISDDGIGCAPFSPQIKNTSSGATNYVWTITGPNFDQTIEGQTPDITLNNPGIYSITLQASNDTGSQTLLQENIIEVLNSPIVMFDFTVSGFTLFTNNQSQFGESYSWDFGDDTESSMLESPSHTFIQNGTYQVLLTAVNACGENSIQNTVEISNQAPTANFSANTTEACAPIEIQFNDLSTGSDLNYLWEFEGGIPAFSDSPSPIVSYNEAGEYDVSLTVTNLINGGATVIKNQYIKIEDIPNSNFTWTQSSNLDVLFINNSTDADQYQWDFGDGTPNSFGQSPVHTYSEIGTYEVTLTTTNDCGTHISAQLIDVGTTNLTILSKNDIFQIHPNPNTGIFYIDINLEKWHGNNISYNIFNILGQSTTQGKFIHNDLVKIPILLENIPSGVYLIQLINKDDHLSKKIIISN